MNGTLNDLLVKYIDYGSEEYVKQLAVNQRSDRKLKTLEPFVGVISYPSAHFLNAQLAYQKSVQYQDSTYIGFLEFLLPPVVSLVDNGLSYTVLEFKLDNYLRQFVQVSSGYTVSGGLTFQDFVLNKFKNCNKGIPYNRSALHTITDIEIYGAVYEASNTADKFTVVNEGKGAFTPSIQFEISVSGYRAIIL